MFPSHEQRSDLRPRSVTDKKYSDKHHIFEPTAGARCTIVPKLCVVIELVETIKNGAIIFRSNA